MGQHFFLNVTQVLRGLHRLRPIPLYTLYTINAAAPEGTPPWRFEISFDERNFLKTTLPGEAPTRRPSNSLRRAHQERNSTHNNILESNEFEKRKNRVV
jgi:hypothetical protein